MQVKLFALKNLLVFTETKSKPNHLTKSTVTKNMSRNPMTAETFSKPVKNSFKEIQRFKKPHVLENEMSFAI